MQLESLTAHSIRVTWKVDTYVTLLLCRIPQRSSQSVTSPLISPPSPSSQTGSFAATPSATGSTTPRTNSLDGGSAWAWVPPGRWRASFWATSSPPPNTACWSRQRQTQGSDPLPRRRSAPPWTRVSVHTWQKDPVPFMSSKAVFVFLHVVSPHIVHCCSRVGPQNHTSPPGNNADCSACDCCHRVGGQRHDHQDDLGSGCAPSSSGFAEVKSVVFIKSLFRLLRRSVLPEAPVVTLTGVKDNTFSLVWAPGLEGDSPITRFILEYKAVNGKTFFISASSYETFISNLFTLLHSLLGFHKDSCGVWPWSKRCHHFRDEALHL